VVKGWSQFPGAAVLIAVALAAGCGVPPVREKPSRPEVTASPSKTTLEGRAAAAAATFMSQLEGGSYPEQWGELAPVAQAQWPSEAARTAMLSAKFQGPAEIVSFTVGHPNPAPPWVSPEDPSESVSGGIQVPVSVRFSAPQSLRPQGVAGEYQRLVLVLAGAKGGRMLVVGSGPASLDAPIIEPARPRQETAAVPVLMYHVVAPFPTRSRWNSQYAYDLEYGLTVTPSQFASQMAFLVSRAAHAISLNRLADFLLYGLPLPAHPVVITFDDGRASPYQYAVPLLRQDHLTATFFIPTGLVGKYVTTETGYNPQHYLSWTQIDSLAHTGFWVEDHTLDDNVALWGLGQSEVDQLAGETAQTLYQQTGRPVQFIAYSGLWPFSTATGVGPAQTQLFTELAGLGYVAGVVDARTDSEQQRTSEIWQIPRIRMNPNELGTQLAPWMQ